jgi:hypothetical protein
MKAYLRDAFAEVRLAAVIGFHPSRNDTSLPDSPA